MAKQVVMPQMGESVAEGTIVRWLKKVGDAVERDEPLFEISTDKVDAEIPSPAAGVLSDVKVKEGETVPINTVVGVIDETAAKPASAAPARQATAGKPAARCCTQPHLLHLPHPLHPSPLPKGTVILPGVSVPTRPSHPPPHRSPPPALRRDKPHQSHLEHLLHPLHDVLPVAAPVAPGLAQSLVGCRSARTAAVASCAKDRARASRRRAQYCGQRRRRPRHEERHPRVHRGRALPPPHLRHGRRCFRLRAGAPADRPASSVARAQSVGNGWAGGRQVRAHADERHAQEDRRAHGDEQAHIAARAFGIRDRFHQGRRDPQSRRKPSTKKQAASSLTCRSSQRRAPKLSRKCLS